MAPNVYIKSLIWLAGLGGLGYALLQLTPDNRGTADQFKTKYSTILSDEQKKNQQLLDKLRDSTKETPIYLKKQN
jgi:hypothetical protein